MGGFYLFFFILLFLIIDFQGDVQNCQIVYNVWVFLGILYIIFNVF